MIYYIIPARKNSKGLPFKNRTLFQYTANIIPEDYYSNVLVTTDDEQIKELSPFKVIDRPEELATDTANTRDVLIHATKDLKETDTIVMLYLTYPERTFSEVDKMIKFFYDYKCKSLLCRKGTKTHPYLCIYESGKQVIKHDLCRRQDYPKIFEISHYVFIATVKELKNLNTNLYNIDTFYYEIDDKIDVDTQGDLNEYCLSDFVG